MKKIKIPLSRLVSYGFGHPVFPAEVVLTQEPGETYTDGGFLVIPEQEVEVEIDETRGGLLDSAVRRLTS